MKQSLLKLRAVLLDRDGVINQEPGPILKPSQFRFIPKSAQAIAQINSVGWLALLITNQGALARKQMEWSDLAKITFKMNKGLAEHGGRIDGQYCCPHHPDWLDGKKLTISSFCSCRKPEIGLLQRACGAHGILPEETVMIGDTTKDFEAARRFGCISIGVRTGHAGQDKTCKHDPDFWLKDLASAIQWLTEETE